METIKRHISRTPVRAFLTKPATIFTLLTLTVLLPMLLPGYIFGLDMAFTPHIPLPEQVTSSYLFYAVLHFLNLVIPSQILQKAMLFIILFASGYGMFRLMQHLQSSAQETSTEKWGAYLAGTFYMINPFTYSRFMAGQFAVLLGYALLPFFARQLLIFVSQPGTRPAVLMAAWAIIISIASVHTVGSLLVLAGVGFVVALWKSRRSPATTRTIFVSSLIGLGVFLFASCYWLMPSLAGSNQTAHAVQGFTSGDRQAFTTVGQTIADKVGNVLQLQGFWADTRDLYMLPQKQLPVIWGIVALAVLVLVITGGVAAWRRGYRSTVLIFGSCGIIAIALATTGILASLDKAIPILSGYREPQKFIGLLALAYAVFIGFAAHSILARFSERQKATTYSFVLMGLVLIPVLFTPTMFWAFAGQLKPHNYPADWQMISNQLGKDNDSQALFLPWHLYMYYGFTDQIMVSPADKFFDKPTIVNNQLELGGASPTVPDRTKDQINDVMKQAGNRSDLGHQLKRFNVEYVILAKEYDFNKYRYLSKQQDLRLIADTTHFKLYRNITVGNK